MRRLENINVNKAILHVLDQAHDEPILNDYEQDLDDEVLVFLENHLSKSLRDEEAKAAQFEEGRNLVKDCCEAIVNNPESSEEFIRSSKDLGKHLFKCMKINEAIPSCDLVVCLFNSEDKYYVALLKLDYTRTYVHNMEFLDGRFRISIVPQLVGLPGSGQRLQNCAFFGLDGGESQLLVINKQAKSQEIAIANFFPGTFLRCEYKADALEKTKRLKSAAEEWTRKSLKDDAEKAEAVRSTVTQALRKSDAIDLNEMSKKAFAGDAELRESFVEHLSSKDLSGTIDVDPNWVEKNTKKVRLRTDSGIEIGLPYDIYEDPDKFKVQKNGNGTLTIIIPGIRNYKER